MLKSLYPEWESVLQELSVQRGTVAVIGSVDSGKTTFSTLLMNALLQNGASVGFADLDLGQSEIGPPTTLGYAILEAPVESLREVTPQGLYFVGYHAPIRHLSLTLVGAERILSEIRAAQPDAILVDTCGFVQGVAARHFKLLLLDSLRPDFIVAIQREHELEPILEALERREDWRLYRVPLPAVITRKSPLFRAQRRRAHFARYFAEATLHSLSLDRVSLLGKRLGSGKRLSEEQLKRLERGTGATLLHAERWGTHVLILTPENLADEQVATIQHLTQADHLGCLHPNTYQHLLVGLTDYGGRTFGIGILQNLDFRERTLKVLSPVQSVEPVRWLHLGSLRLLPDGTELGELQLREA